MNELTLEQKAEAYNKALERAREALNDGTISSNTIAYLQDIFPELKEGEDDRIKQRIIKLIKMSNKVGGFALHKWEADKMLFWLEKQSEQKSAKWSEEDELRIRELESLVKEVWTIAEQENDNNTIHKMSDLSFFLKTLKPHKLRRQQRDILLKAINDAGYTFDFKNKELKKIKQNPIWSEEDEYYRNIILHILNNECVGETDKENALNWFKSIKPQKSAGEIDDVVNFSDDEKCLDEDLEKRLDEQKPKFKIGDWVIVNNKHQSIYQIEKIEDGYYILRHTHGGTFRVCVLHDGSLRPWTIQDAKEGDIIITKNKNIFIFKLIRDCTIYDYCGLYFGKFIEFSSAVNGRLAAKLPTNYAPATKEQRDTLMKAMTDAGYAFDFEKKELKKIEQKYEPKFKVGDWIIFNNNSDACRVEEIEDGVYTLRNSIGGKMVLSSVLDKLIRHWTIKDAEDGDVLVIAENGEPFIFKGCSDVNHPNAPVAYFGINDANNFYISPNDKWWTSAKVLPATKEQRNILFGKMKKAGYKWDAVKKKLKKIKK